MKRRKTSGTSILPGSLFAGVQDLLLKHKSPLVKTKGLLCLRSLTRDLAFLAAQSDVIFAQ